MAHLQAFTQEIELKKLTRALQREVGEDVPLGKVLDEGSSDWKGRREQILALRNQVQALKAAQVSSWQLGWRCLSSAAMVSSTSTPWEGALCMLRRAWRPSRGTRWRAKRCWPR